MTSFTLSTFLCVAVFSSTILGEPFSVSHSVEMGQWQYLCPEPWTHHNGRCFLHVAEKKTWVEAEKHCLHLGGNLASEHSEDEHEFLKMLHRTEDSRNGPFWIGLSDTHKERVWLWSDGTSASSEGDFKKWNPGEPNNFLGNEDCVHSNYGGKKDWNDVNCQRKYPFICALRM